MSRLIRSAAAFFGSLPRKASAIVAAFLLLVTGYAVLATVSLEGGDSDSGGGMGLSPAALRSVAVGTSRGEVEGRVGSGLDALEWAHTGTALEPMDATCTYYLASDSLSDVVQLCYRDDALVSKQTYSTPQPG